MVLMVDRLLPPTMRPDLYRVSVIALVIAGAANVLLYDVSASDDWFANIIAIISGVVAAVLVLSWAWRPLMRLREEAFLFALIVWVANTIEFATQDGPHWENKVRNCGFYVAFAVIALGAYLAQRIERHAAELDAESTI